MNGLSKLVGIAFTSLLITACGDSPSNLGKQVQAKLEQQKSAFESNRNQSDFNNFINNSHWSPELKRTATDAMNNALSLSAKVNPEHARAAIESSEMALGCTLVLIQDPHEVDLFISNATNSISNDDARYDLALQFIKAKKLILQSAITKETCRP